MSEYWVNTDGIIPKVLAPPRLAGYRVAHAYFWNSSPAGDQ
jgi:hypothetical protein